MTIDIVTAINSYANNFILSYVHELQKDHKTDAQGYTKDNRAHMGKLPGSTGYIKLQ